MPTKRQQKDGQPLRYAFRSLMEAAVVHGVQWVVGHTSWKTTYLVSDYIALLYHGLVGGRRRVAKRNLAIAFNNHLTPQQLNSLSLQVCRNVMKTLCEFLRLPAMTSEELRARTRLEGCEHLDRGLAAGKGVLLVTAHFGNWEIMGARLALEGYPITVVAREANNPYVARTMDEIRRSSGMGVIAKGRALREGLRTLRNNCVLGILPDQHAGDSGIVINFFGRPTPMHPIVAMLALRTGAAVVLGFSARDENDVIHIRILPSFELVRTGERIPDIVTNTAKLAAIIEDEIRQHPTQWFWLHRRWRDSDPATMDPEVQRLLLGDNGDGGSLADSAPVIAESASQIGS